MGAAFATSSLNGVAFADTSPNGAAFRRCSVECRPGGRSNFMISLQKHKLHGQVIHVWNQMLEANVVPNQFTFAVVVSSKEALLEEAMDAFAEMKRHKFVPEEVTYSLLISLSAKNEISLAKAMEAILCQLAYLLFT